MKVGLSVVIPAYNEEANTASCLTSIYAVLKKSNFDWEIIFVNDGSKDKTGQIAKSFIKKIPHLKVVENKPNRGYGGSLRAGFAAATKEFISFVPSDNQFDFSEINKLFQVQRETQADIVSGIRLGGGADPFLRKVNRFGWNTTLTLLFGKLATDVDCGFKLFKRNVLTKVHLTSSGALIDTQLFAGAKARNLKIAETPVTHLPRTAGKPTGANPRVIIKAFVELFKFRLQLTQELLSERGLALPKWELIAFATIFLLAAFLKLYRIDSYMTFLGDEGRDMLVVRDIVLGRHFPAIGPGTSIGSMYLGPLYYYLIAPSLFISHFSPLGPAVFIAFVGLATLTLLWWIARQWVGRVPALSLSLLYAISPIVISYSRSSWNPNIMPFFALICIYGIWHIWRQARWNWIIPIGISFAFVLNSHYLGLLLLPTLGLFWLVSPKNPAAMKKTWISAGLFLLLMLPLAIFDSRHGWTNFSAFKTFFTNRGSTVNLKVYKSLPNLYPVWLDINTSLLTAADSLLGQIVAVILAIYVGFELLTKRKTVNRDLLLTVVWLFVGLIGLGLYKQHIYVHYYGFIFPAVFLLLGFLFRSLLSSSLGKLAYVVMFLVLVGVNLSHSPLLITPNDQLHRTQKIADFIDTYSHGQPYNLALVSKTNYDASYRYLLALKNSPYKTIREQITDQLFVICENPNCQPINNPLWEIASFGWAKVDNEWDFPWGVKVFHLIHNPSGV